MLVLEDDSLLCDECYGDEGGDYIYRPAHKQVYAEAEAGTCGLCGESYPRNAQPSAP